MRTREEGRGWKYTEKAEERKGAGSATVRITGTRDLSASWYLR